MSTEVYKYNVMVEGIDKPLPYDSLDQAFEAIRWFMPCKVTIDAVKLKSI